MSIWFAYGKTESGDDFTVGYWEFEPSDCVVAEVILEKYDWLIDPGRFRPNGDIPVVFGTT